MPLESIGSLMQRALRGGLFSREIAEGVARLRSGDPQARLGRTASLTVSNLGGSGIESFAAVINPPESRSSRWARSCLPSRSWKARSWCRTG